MLLLYSRHCSGSVEWARYLHKLFTELSRNKSRLTVRHLPVEVQIVISSQYNNSLSVWSGPGWVWRPGAAPAAGG